MIYEVLAEIVVVIHFCFVLYVVLGAFLGFKWIKTLYIHLCVLAWGVYIEFSGTICPLTPLENWLRQQANQHGYEGGFLAHYIVPIVYPETLTRSDQMVLGGLLLGLNLLVYSAIFFRRQLLKKP